MTRRQFLQRAAAGAALVSAPGVLVAADKPTLPDPTLAKLPRWRGFNLLEWFDGNHRHPFREDDFSHIAELGFNFVRLPLSYRCWNSGKVEDWDKIDEKALEQVDGKLRPAKSPRWKRDADLLAWLDSL